MAREEKLGPGSSPGRRCGGRTYPAGTYAGSAPCIQWVACAPTLRHCERSEVIHGLAVLPIAAVVVGADDGSWIATSPAAPRNDERGEGAIVLWLMTLPLNQAHFVPSRLRVTTFHPAVPPDAAVVAGADGGSWIATSPAGPRNDEGGEDAIVLWLMALPLSQTHFVPSRLRVISFHPAVPPIAAVVAGADGGSWIATSPAPPRNDKRRVLVEIGHSILSAVVTPAPEPGSSLPNKPPNKPHRFSPLKSRLLAARAFAG